MQEQFVKNESKIKNDFKQKIKNLQDFFAQMNNKYNYSFRKLGPQKIKEKLTEIRQNFRHSRETPLKYIKIKGARFLTILQEKKDQEILDSQSVLSELKAFKPLFSTKVRYKIKEKFADDLYAHLKPKT